MALVVCVLFLSRENKNTTQRIPCGFCCPQREQRGYQPCRISSFLFDKAWSKPLALRLPLRADVTARCRVAHRSVNVEISHSSSRVAATLGQAPQQSPHSLQNSTEYISNVHGGFHAAQRRGYLCFYGAVTLTHTASAADSLCGAVFFRRACKRRARHRHTNIHRGIRSSSV